MEQKAENNKYPAAMRAAHPPAAEAVALSGGPGVGGGHRCRFHVSSAAQRARATAVGVERRQRAGLAYMALTDLIEALDAEGGKRVPEIVEQLREVAVAVRYLTNP